LACTLPKIHFSADVQLSDLNSTMRRIDLFAKLLAPVFISVLDGFSATIAVWTVLGLNVLSVLVEYFAIAQVCLMISLH